MYPVLACRVMPCTRGVDPLLGAAPSRAAACCSCAAEVVLDGPRSPLPTRDTVLAWAAAPGHSAVGEEELASGAEPRRLGTLCAEPLDAGASAPDEAGAGVYG